MKHRADVDTRLSTEVCSIKTGAAWLIQTPFTPVNVWLEEAMEQHKAFDTTLFKGSKCI